MQDFETLIGQVLAQGKSPEEVAKMFTASFNSAMKQKEEAEKKTLREDMIEKLDAIFWSHVEEKKLTSMDAAALVFLIVTNDTEWGKSLTEKEDLAALYDHIVDTLKHIEDSFHVKQTLKKAFGGIEEIFDCDLAQIFSVPKGDNKSKETSGRTDRKDKPNRSDEQRIKDFLKNL